MTSVIYKGTSNYKELDAADLKKAGVEEGFKKTSFERGVSVEVTDDVATALVDNESGLFEGEFELAKEKTPDEGDGEDPAPAARGAAAKKAASSSAMTDSGTTPAVGSGTSAGASGTTGAGTSTATSTP